MKELSREAALNKAASYCSLCERCISEVRKKLQSWRVSDSDATYIIERLIDEKFIDEVRYCHAFTNDKLRFNHWGRIKIAGALREKMIPSETINEALDAIDPEEYINALQYIIESKRRELVGIDDFTANGKIIRYASSRGFEPHIIMKQLNFYSDALD